MNRPETIEETAELVTSEGGIGIPVRVDHNEEEEVRKLFEQVKEEQGYLDILVNNVWGVDSLLNWSVPFWKHSLEDGLFVQIQGVHSHIVTNYYAVPLMRNRDRALIVEITDSVGYDYLYGNLYYDLAKVATKRLARGMAKDLRADNIAVIALAPGFMRTEAGLQKLGVTEENWRDAIVRNPRFASSETPRFVGRAVAALATDKNIMERTGENVDTLQMAGEYGFTDVDGTTPVPYDGL
jgi:NAD(P)-dependent dehydrogenase (short-subunit alcohol dehydrogenase family)